MKKELILLLTLLTVIITSQAQNIQVQKADFEGGARSGAVSFSINGKGYISTGYDGINYQYKKDLWEYDPVTDTWAQKADFGGKARQGAVGFSISNKGYIGTGYAAGVGYSKDFWEYDPIINSWTQKSNLAGTARVNAVGFSIGTKGYIGLGEGSYTTDFWEYDPVTDTWTPKANFGGTFRYSAVGFFIGSKGYIGTGEYGGPLLKDFWEYDPNVDSWTQKTDFGGTGRYAAVGFSIANKGYIGTGNDYYYGYQKDVWEYNPATNSWKQAADFGGIKRSDAVSFSIGSKGYIGTGTISVNPYYTADFWQYTTDTLETLPLASNFLKPGEAVIVNYIGDLTFNSGNIFTAQLSGSSGSFSSPINIGFLLSTMSGTISATIPSSIPAGTAYRIRVVSSDPEIIGSDNGDNLSIGPNYGKWIQKADFAGEARYGSVGFSIGNKGYIGTGYYNRKDFWEYDSATDSWTQKADFGGQGRDNAYAFSLNNKGYIGGGHRKNDYYAYNSYFSDFWEYDPVTNTWQQKAYGGYGEGVTAFTIGGKGYVCGGSDYVGYFNDYYYFNTFGEYDPVTNTWTEKANFGGGERAFSTGFSIGDKGYIGGGYNNNGGHHDFWEYNPANDTWTKKEDLPGGGVGLSIENNGYVGTGSKFWQYHPEENSWEQKADFGGGFNVGFSIGNKGYVETGQLDFWEYTPDSFNCEVPVNLSVTNITSSSATLKWDAVGGAEGYKVRYKVSGTNEWTNHKITIGKSRQLNNLSPNTSYTWQSKTYCTVNPGSSSDWSAKQMFTTASLRIGNEPAEQILFQIYPNPASDKITISFPSYEKGELQIVNPLGQIVFSKEINSTTEEIDVSKFPNGVYLITATTATQKFESNFLKQ